MEHEGAGMSGRLRLPIYTTTLTQTERDVLILLARGLEVQQVANSMYRHRRTVDRALRNCRDKLGDGTKASLVARAIFAGIITHEDVLKERSG